MARIGNSGATMDIAEACGDLRGWLTKLGESGRLAAITRSASLDHEIAGIAKRLDGEKASFFANVAGRSGRVVSGLLSNRSWMAEALGLREDHLLDRFQDAVTSPLPWREVDDGPCREVVHDKPDLQTQLPIPTHNEHDSGAYITAGMLIVRNPRTGRQNVSIHRLQVSGPARLGALLLPRHTLAFHEWRKRPAMTSTWRLPSVSRPRFSWPHRRSRRWMSTN